MNGFSTAVLIISLIAALLNRAHVAHLVPALTQGKENLAPPRMQARATAMARCD
jgi:hypothetical protein